MSTLRHRLKRLERLAGDLRDRPSPILVQMPGNKPDVVLWQSGKQTCVPDGNLVAREYAGHAKVLVGIDLDWL